MTQSEVEDIAACLLEGLEAQSNGVAEDDRVMWDLTHQALMSSDVSYCLPFQISQSWTNVMHCSIGFNYFTD